MNPLRNLCNRAVEGCPVGLSFAAGHYQDEALLLALSEFLRPRDR